MNAFSQTVKITAVGRHLPLVIRDAHKNATARKHLIISCVSSWQRDVEHRLKWHFTQGMEVEMC